MKKIVSISAGLLFLTLVFVSCRDEKGNAITDFFKPAIVDIESLESKLNVDSARDIYSLVTDIDSSFTNDDLAKLYSEKQSIWFDKFGLNENGQKLITQLRIAHTEGLNPNDYFFSDLANVSDRIPDLNEQELYELELKMSYAFAKYAKHLLLGRIEPLEIDKNWQNNNDSTWSIDSLSVMVRRNSVEEVLNDFRPHHPWYNKFWSTARSLDKLKDNGLSKTELPQSLRLGDSTEAIRKIKKVLAKTVDSTLNNSMVWDQLSIDALRQFQKNFSIAATGELDSATKAALTQDTEEKLKQLGMNMERMRWLQKDFLDEYIWVNVPEMDVKYFERDTVTFKMNAVIGKISRKTPTLDSKLSNIVFNPPWFVPPTILKQEIVPGIARRGGSYLRRRGLVARDRRGRIVNPSRINSKNYRRYSISQNPGRNSALGSVKFNFPNKEAIFLHDTNHRWGFNKKYRASSSGCIRVHHPKDFARFLLRDSTFSATAIDSIIKRRATKSVKIKRDIGVHLVYLTNAVDSAGRVIEVNDIYKWDKKLAAKL